MIMTVKTLSGSIYHFAQKDGRTFFRRDLLTGEVVRIKNSPIAIGKKIIMHFHKEGLYNQPVTSTMFVETTPVTEISVTL